MYNRGIITMTCVTLIRLSNKPPAGISVQRSADLSTSTALSRCYSQPPPGQS